MFNFCEEFLILASNEVVWQPCHKLNILRRSEMQMFFLDNRIKMEGEQY